MGMFTELVLAAELRQDLPWKVYTPLKQMLQQPIDGWDEVPEHDFFTTKKWRYMLVSDSCFFAGRAHSALYCDPISGAMTLTVRCNLKNYDDEIDLFLDWLSPYIVTRGFLGYVHDEGYPEPTLIYHDGKIKHLEPLSSMTK